VRVSGVNSDCGQITDDPSKLARYLFRGWGLIDLLLRASNEGFLKPRVARAQKIISPHPLLHFLKISLGSVIFPIETATNSHPLDPNSFSIVCIFWVSGSTSTILY
jgi:hypothetical protein